MRKLNTIFSVILIVIFLLHGIFGSLQLLRVNVNFPGKTLGWIGMAVLAAHTVIGVILTIQTLRASKKNGDNYIKQNALFWTRRASGLAILILIFFHIGTYGAKINGNFVLFEFTTVKLIAQLLLIVALFVHIFVNVKPHLMAKGVIKHKERRVDIFLILSVLVLFFSGAVIFYYIMWQV